MSWLTWLQGHRNGKPNEPQVEANELVLTKGAEVTVDGVRCVVVLIDPPTRQFVLRPVSSTILFHYGQANELELERAKED